MTWEGSRSYSYGVDALLASLSPKGQPEGRREYPSGVDRATLRFQGGETIKSWFDRCVNAFMPGPQGLESWQLEENLAAFASVSWKRGNLLEHATINILKTECSLRDYFGLTEDDLKAKDYQDYSKPSYLRLDLDYGTLGPVGTHPLPHVHCSPDDPPRFASNASRSTNVVVDFFDFVYRHHFSPKWQLWAEQVWNRRYLGEGRDPNYNPFPRIIASYNESQVGVIRSLADDINKLAVALDEEKDQLFELRVSDADRRLMMFPDLP